MPKSIQEDSDDIGRSPHYGGPCTWKTFVIVHSKYRAILGSIVSLGARKGREASVLYKSTHEGIRVKILNC